MITDDNPAGRLHTLLSRFKANGSAGGSIVDAWATTINLNKDDPAFRRMLGRVASLPADVHDAVIAAELGPEYIEMSNDYTVRWSQPILLWNCPPDNAVPADLVQQDSLSLLAALSGILHRDASEGRVPANEQLAQIHSALQEALNEIRTSDLDPGLIRLLIQRLHDLLAAVETVIVGGPGAVLAAVERLAATYDRQSTSTKATSPLKKLAAALATTWMAFVAPGDVPPAIESWTTVIDVVQAELMPPEPPEQL